MKKQRDCISNADKNVRANYAPSLNRPEESGSLFWTTSGDDCETDEVRLELERFLENSPGRFHHCGNFGFLTIRILF